MKKFIFIILSLFLITVTSCETLATDNTILKTSDDLIGSYRLDKVEDAFFTMDGELISKVISCEYIDDGYHSYYDWCFGQNGAFRIYYTEWADTGERGKYKPTELKRNGCYMLDKKDLTIFDGYNTEKYTIERFIKPGNLESMLTISYESITDPGASSLHTIRSKVKRTIYLHEENSYNYNYF